MHVDALFEGVEEMKSIAISTYPLAFVALHGSSSHILASDVHLRLHLLHHKHAILLETPLTFLLISTSGRTS